MPVLRGRVLAGGPLVRPDVRPKHMADFQAPLTLLLLSLSRLRSVRTQAKFAACVAALLTAASCASSEPTTSTPPSEATESAASGADPSVGVDVANVASECASTEEGLDAADTFDEAGLNERDLRFVPLDDPEMVTAAEVTWLEPDDIIMGVLHESGEAHAYPVSQMIYHHVANTSIAGEPYVVTY